MEKVILYTSETCPRCKIVKDMLNIHSVQYEEITDRELILSMDLESVPAIEVGDTLIDNYVMVLNWLRQNGYYNLAIWGDDKNESN